MASEAAQLGKGARVGKDDGKGDEPKLSAEDIETSGGLAYGEDAQKRQSEGGKKGGQTRAAQMGTEGYREMGRKGGLAKTGQSGEEAAREQGIEIDESKYKTTASLSDVAKK